MEPGVVGTREIFYHDITAFYEMLQAQGIESELFTGEGMNHVYMVYPIPEADAAFDQIAAAIRRGFAGQQVGSWRCDYESDYCS